MTTAGPPGDLLVEMLPARHGDALLLTWGEEGRRRRMLIDGGPATAYESVRTRLVEVADEGPLDLLVLTHIDGDHIEGLILLVNDAAVALDIKNMWFNGSAQLVDEMGPVQGEILSALVTARDIPWNAHFGNRAVCVDDDGPLPVRELPGGLRLTVLGPDRATLRRLRDNWRQTCEDAHLEFGSAEEALAVLRGRKYLNPAAGYLGEERLDVHALATAAAPKDYSLSNKSSIVLLAEYGSARVLLAGDATPGALVPAIRRLLAERGLVRLPLSAFKLPHHGSAGNVTAEVLDLAPAEHYLFSSDGSQFGHPDDSAVARVLEASNGGVNLVFNYRTGHTRQWDSRRPAADGYHYTTHYPDEGAAGVALALCADAGRSQ